MEQKKPKETAVKKKKAGSKGSASGRNKAKCDRYRLLDRKVTNKMRRLYNRIRKFPNDKSAITEFKKVFDTSTSPHLRKYREFYSSL